MAIRAISHVAVGVRDMDRALRFYRDALGLRVKLDTVEEIPAFEGPKREAARRVPRLERGSARIVRRARSAAEYAGLR
jgi:catechol 2,3-dioxygenase-like lactoylglutathione lyase family enzyme